MIRLAQVVLPDSRTLRRQVLDLIQVMLAMLWSIAIDLIIGGLRAIVVKAWTGILILFADIDGLVSHGFSGPPVHLARDRSRVIIGMVGIGRWDFLLDL